MKIDSDVKLELMPVEGETTEGFIARLRELHTAKSLAHIDAKRALSQARTDLAATSRRGAHPEEYREVRIPRMPITDSAVKPIRRSTRSRSPAPA